MSAGSVAGGNTTFAPSMASKPKSYLDHIRTRRKKPKTYILTPAQASSSSCQYERHDWVGPMRGPRGGKVWKNVMTGRTTYHNPHTGSGRAAIAAGNAVHAAGAVEHKASDAVRALVSRLPAPAQAIVAASYKATMAGYSAGRNAAVEAAKQGGASPEKAEQIGKTLGHDRPPGFKGRVCGRGGCRRWRRSGVGSGVHRAGGKHRLPGVQ
jgi:hypothetical protein